MRMHGKVCRTIARTVKGLIDDVVGEQSRHTHGGVDTFPISAPSQRPGLATCVLPNSESNCGDGHS